MNPVNPAIRVATIIPEQATTWQKQLANVVTDADELLALLDLDQDPQLLAEARQASRLFPLRVPRDYIARMRKCDLSDPLLRQVLPIDAEAHTHTGYSNDPLAENDANPLPGLLHKYHGRVLLTVTGSCAINCRYCFRRHFNYRANNPGAQGWRPVCDYIRKDATISEVILSGGEPLLAPDKTLQNLLMQLSEIKHLQRLRIHTRLPIVLPARITENFIACLKQCRLHPIVVIHCNHHQEINDTVTKAMMQLKQHHITVLNQAVLLKDVNDNIDALAGLCEQLFAIGVLPYYLHLLDKVQGTAHFDVPESKAIHLHRQLLARLPGYLVPKLARECATANAKIIL